MDLETEKLFAPPTPTKPKPPRLQVAEGNNGFVFSFTVHDDRQASPEGSSDESTTTTVANTGVTSVLQTCRVTPYEEGKDVRHNVSVEIDSKPAEREPTISTPSPKLNLKRPNDGVDGNKRSQKRIKRKRHRPKVVVEGKTKKVPKSVKKPPATAKSVSASIVAADQKQKRKYVRKKPNSKQDNPVIIIPPNQDSAPKLDCLEEDGRVQKQKRKYVRKKPNSKQDNPVIIPPNQDSAPKLVCLEEDGRVDQSLALTCVRQTSSWGSYAKRSTRNCGKTGESWSSRGVVYYIDCAGKVWLRCKKRRTPRRRRRLISAVTSWFLSLHCSRRPKKCKKRRTKRRLRYLVTERRFSLAEEEDTQITSGGETLDFDLNIGVEQELMTSVFSIDLNVTPEHQEEDGIEHIVVEKANQEKEIVNANQNGSPSLLPTLSGWEVQIPEHQEEDGKEHLVVEKANQEKELANVKHNCNASFLPFLLGCEVQIPEYQEEDGKEHLVVEKANQGKELTNAKHNCNPSLLPFLSGWEVQSPEHQEEDGKEHLVVEKANQEKKMANAKHNCNPALLPSLSGCEVQIPKHQEEDGKGHLVVEKANEEKEMANAKRNSDPSPPPALSQCGVKSGVKGKKRGRKKILKEKDIDFKNLTEDMVEMLIGRRLQALTINDTGIIVPYEGFNKKKFLPQIVLDKDSLSMWNQVIRIDNGEQKANEEDESRWESERETFRGRVKSFSSRMNLFLGDKTYKVWKGSVLDSIIGVFLTQNVSDCLSSSAYMKLVANFPVQPSPSSAEVPEQESNTASSEVPSGSYFVTHPDADTNNSILEEETGILTTVQNNDTTRSLSEEKSTDGRGQCVGNSIGKVGNQESGEPQMEWLGKISTVTKKKKPSEMEGKDWDSLRKKYSRPRERDHSDSADWYAVSQADPRFVADVIKERGQHNQITARIQKFLKDLVKLHGDLDLEWLRYAPPDDGKEYLLQIKGIGLKSVECIRLLALEHIAFPVDTNVGRIAVRLGWVPLQTLPGDLQLHLLEEYPLMDSIQKYLWPRLCVLDHRTLFQLHYQMITFGKIFCTKRNPNCNKCPMRAECRHFASAVASAKLSLPKPSKTDTMKTAFNRIGDSILSENCELINDEMPRNKLLVSKSASQSCEPQVEFSKSPQNYEPQVEFPKSPQNHKPHVQFPESPKRQNEDADDVADHLAVGEIPDIEEIPSIEDIPVIRLTNESCITGAGTEDNTDHDALVLISQTVLPTRKLKHINYLRTEHIVYELPDYHDLVKDLSRGTGSCHEKYLLAIWTPGEIGTSFQPSKNRCNSEGSELCDDWRCLSCETIREKNAGIVRGTLLIPVKLAVKGRFPLGGTYFQTNEVFADHETSFAPLNVSRSTLWNLRKRMVYFGTSTSAIYRGGSSMEDIQRMSLEGFICVRGFDRKTGEPKPLSRRFHCPPSKMTKEMKDADVN